MTVSRTRIESKYMQWAKLESTAPVNLATSAVVPLSLAELPLKLEDLALDTHDSYGYAPLLERLARYTGVDPEGIVTAPGTSMANARARAAAFEPGDEVVLIEPLYDSYLPILGRAGGVDGGAAGAGQRPAQLAHQLRVLESKGYLRRDPNRPRAVEVLMPDSTPRRAVGAAETDCRGGGNGKDGRDARGPPRRLPAARHRRAPTAPARVPAVTPAPPVTCTLTS